MYRSGRWRCVWEQDGVRHTEWDLELTFENWHVTGSGRDVDGRFIYTGTYDATGAVRLVKSYRSGKGHGHAFAYEGAVDDEGGITGVWRNLQAPEICGAFWMRLPKDLSQPAEDMDGSTEPWAGLQVRPDDLGLEIVRKQYRICQVDREWSVLEERGYRWWSGLLAQRI